MESLFDRCTHALGPHKRRIGVSQRRSGSSCSDTQHTPLPETLAVLLPGTRLSKVGGALLSHLLLVDPAPAERKAVAAAPLAQLERPSPPSERPNIRFRPEEASEEGEDRYGTRLIVRDGDGDRSPGNVSGDKDPGMRGLRSTEAH